LKHQREKLSNYPETINQLSEKSSSTIKLSPPLYKGEIDSRESDSSGWREVDLFPEDDTTSEAVPPITDLVARLKNKGARVIEGADLERALADSTDTTFSKFTGVPVEEQDDATEGQEPTDE